MLNFSKWMQEKAQYKEQQESLNQKLEQVLAAVQDIRNELGSNATKLQEIENKERIERTRIGAILNQINLRFQNKVQVKLTESQIVIKENGNIVDCFEYEQGITEEAKGAWVHSKNESCSPFSCREHHILYSSNIGWLYGQLDQI